MARPGLDGFAPGTVIGRRYEILRPLRLEPYGPVYLARDQVLEVDVSLKFLFQDTPDFDRVLEYFRQEAILGLKLHHPQILGVQQLDEAPEGIFLVQELCQGNSLVELLSHQEVLTQDDALYFLEVLAQGLAFAHKHGIVHQWFYPGNILVSATEGIKVSNFAFPPDLAAAREQPQLGAYLPPELWEEGKCSPQSNIFALGVIGYQMLAGDYPYPWQGGTPVPYQLTAEPPGLTQLPPVWQALFRACLAPTPSGRPTSLTEVILELHTLRQARQGAVAKSGWENLPVVETKPQADGAAAEVPIEPLWFGSERPGSHSRTRRLLSWGQTQYQRLRNYLGPEPLSRNRRKQVAAGVGLLGAGVLAAALLLGFWPGSPPAPENTAWEEQAPAFRTVTDNSKAPEGLPAAGQPVPQAGLPAGAAPPGAVAPALVTPPPAAPAVAPAPLPAPGRLAGRTPKRPEARATAPSSAGKRVPVKRLVGTYAQAETAQKQAARLRQQGQRAVVQRVVKNRRPYYQVLVLASSPASPAPLARSRPAGRPEASFRR